MNSTSLLPGEALNFSNAKSNGLITKGSRVLEYGDSVERDFDSEIPQRLGPRVSYTMEQQELTNIQPFFCQVGPDTIVNLEKPQNGLHLVE